MMSTCIAVVDATRARLFMLEREVEPDGLHERFEERRDLVNPARRLTPSELFSDSRPGSSRVGSRGFAFDDHRGQAVDKLDADFARQITHQLDALLRDSPVRRLIVCASPHMLGALRATGELAHADVVIDEIPRDLAKLSPAELRDQLVSYGLLPPRPVGPMSH